MTIGAVFGIYVILSLSVDNVKLNTNIPPFLDLTSCVKYVEKNKKSIYDSASIAFGEHQRLSEMGCVEVLKESLHQSLLLT